MTSIWSGSAVSNCRAGKRVICSAVMPPSRWFTSNKSRSKFDETWISMLGLNVGTTVLVAMMPERRKRGRMSLRLEPITSRSTGRPIWRATQPANTLPKLPVGTAKLTGRLRTTARQRGGDVVHDLGHDRAPS